MSESESEDAAIEANVDKFCFRDVSPTLEFIAWVIVLLAPFLRWVNGPSVSRDQFVVRIALVSLAAAAAVGLRLYHWRLQRSQS